MMSCDEFERFGLDLDRPEASPAERALASEHALHCPDCRALLASWREVKADLRLLRETTSLESAPARVAMRLKQELRTRRESRPRSTVTIASWALAAAVVLAVAAGSIHIRQNQSNLPGKSSANLQVAGATPPDPNSEGTTLLAEEFDSTSFTQLPASMPSASSDESVVQVRLQRGALMQFGLPVAPEQASEWVDVDFLVGEDGQPVAVRLHQDSQSE
jgi:hypothetical protein